MDGVLKPGGPTITALGGLLGGTTPASSTAQPKSLFGEFNEGAAPQASIGQAEGDWMGKMNRPGWATSPFGSALGADRWAASDMASALLGRSDYQDAIKHFQGEIARDRAASMPHLAAVHEEMTARNPDLADRFATQMRAAGLTEEGQPPSREDGSSPDSGPGWYRDKDGRLVIIITKPGDGGNGTGSGQGGNGNDGGDQIPIDTVPGNQESKDNGQCRQLKVNAANAALHHKYTSERFREAADQAKELRRQLDDRIKNRDKTILDALGSAAGDCLAAAATAGATTKGKWSAKLSAAAIACIKANLKPEKGFDLGEILSHDDDVGQIERDLAEAVESQKLMLKELEAAGTAMQEAQGALSQAGCSNEGYS